MTEQQQPPPPPQQQQQQRAVFAAGGVPGADATSATLRFEPAVVLMLNKAGMPPNRPDLSRRLPQPVAQHAQALINAVNAHIANDLFQRRGGDAMRQRCALTGDETKALVAFTVEEPPVYLWLNAWMIVGEEVRGDASFLEFVGPFATLFTRALQKLQRQVVPAQRGMLVRDIPALFATFDNYAQRLQPGARLNFWNFASFTTDSNVSSNEHFVGGPGEPALVYQCGALACVSLRPFSAIRRDEEEVMPIAPLRLVVESAVMRDNGKLVIGVRQVDEEASTGYYVEPRTDPRAAIDAAVAEALSEQQQQQQRLEARIRELEAVMSASGARRGAGGGAAAQPAPAPGRDRARAIEWNRRGESLPNSIDTVRVGDRDYTKIQCFVEAALAADNLPHPWNNLYQCLPTADSTVTIGKRVFTKKQCLRRYEELFRVLF